VYETHAGGVSLPHRVVEMLQTWEKVAGAGTARRLVVIDREGHAVAMLRALDEGGRLFLVPVRKNCAEPDGPWKDMGDCAPLDPDQPDGPAVREATLKLNDSRTPAVRSGFARSLGAPRPTTRAPPGRLTLPLTCSRGRSCSSCTDCLGLDDQTDNAFQTAVMYSVIPMNESVAGVAADQDAIAYLYDGP